MPLTSKQIKFRIARNGTVTAETIGIEGPSCIEWVPIIEQLLDAKVIDSTLTPEYFVSEETLTLSPFNIQRNQTDKEK